jgi:hypothetical protein
LNWSPGAQISQIRVVLEAGVGGEAAGAPVDASIGVAGVEVVDALGAPQPRASSKSATSRFVTLWRSSQKTRTKTRWSGCSSGAPSSLPIQNAPPG